jgi:hypothetical protein
MGAMLYIQLWVYDTVDYYLAYLMLSLPSYVFRAPVIRISQFPEDYSSDSSEEEMIEHAIEYDVFISQLIFIFKTKEQPPTMTHRVMHGAQLRSLVDSRGRFFLRRIQQYFPEIDTIIIKYTKIPVANDKRILAPTITKVLDVVKRCDIRTGTSCKMGVIF